MEISVNEIEKILIEEDIEGFIASGAPNDEYAAEAKYIARALFEIEQQEISEESLMALISALWANAFSLSQEDVETRLPAFKRVANYICNTQFK